MGPKKPYGMKYAKFIRIVVQPIRNEISFKRTKTSRGQGNAFNERKKVFNECFMK